MIPDVIELQRENDAFKEYFRRILEIMPTFLPKHFDFKNPQHAAMYEVYHIASHAVK